METNLATKRPDAALSARVFGCTMKTKTKPQWKVSDISAAKYLGTLEIRDGSKDFHIFEVLALPDRLVFGGACNAGFLESGYILRSEDDQATPLHDALLTELQAELETFYSDGARFCTRIVCNDRM